MCIIFICEFILRYILHGTSTRRWVCSDFHLCVVTFAALSVVVDVATVIVAAMRRTARAHATAYWRWLLVYLLGWLTDWLGSFGWLCVHNLYTLFHSVLYVVRSMTRFMRYYAIARSAFSYEIHSYLISHWTFRENSLCLTLNEDGCILYFFSLTVLLSQQQQQQQH